MWGNAGIIGDVKQAKKKAPFRGALIVVGDERFEGPSKKFTSACF
tara:strand:+ start:109 stop:243 length:135 start_codon:yes stop_codon:yes gene_type:complete